MLGLELFKVLQIDFVLMEIMNRNF